MAEGDAELALGRSEENAVGLPDKIGTELGERLESAADGEALDKVGEAVRSGTRSLGEVVGQLWAGLTN